MAVELESIEIDTILSVPFCPYHFVRTILSNTILSGHPYISRAPAKTKSPEPAYYRRFTKTKSIGNGQDPERQTVRRIWWMVFGIQMGREVWERQSIRIGFAKEQRFLFGVKELWRDGKGKGLSEFVGRVSYMYFWREFVPKRRD